MRALLATWLLCVSSLHAAPPPPAEFVDALVAGRIDPETYDLAATGLWALGEAERMQWNGTVTQQLAVGDINNGCDEATLRRARGVMWMILALNSADAASWQGNAAALRARLREFDDRMQAAAARAAGAADPRVAELGRRVAIDQEARNPMVNSRWSAELPPPAEKSWGGLSAARLWSIDCDNMAWLEQQLREIGWFGIEKYGANADKNAWLLVQHADRNKPFQRQVLAMLESLPPGKTDPRNLAYLHDRVAMGEGRPQRYGTQGQCQPDGTWKPNETEDPAGVDARRKALGLAPIAEHALVFKDVCKPATPATAPP